MRHDLSGIYGNEWTTSMTYNRCFGSIYLLYFSKCKNFLQTGTGGGCMCFCCFTYAHGKSKFHIFIFQKWQHCIFGLCHVCGSPAPTTHFRFFIVLSVYLINVQINVFIFRAFCDPCSLSVCLRSAYTPNNNFVKRREWALDTTTTAKKKTRRTIFRLQLCISLINRIKLLKVKWNKLDVRCMSNRLCMHCRQIVINKTTTRS